MGCNADEAGYWPAVVNAQHSYETADEILNATVFANKLYSLLNIMQIGVRMEMVGFP